MRQQQAGAFTAFVFGGCNNTSKSDSKATADTLNNMKDSVVNPKVSVTKDLKMTVNHDDARFAVAAADGGMAEVELGQLAQFHRADQQIKDFGAMMVKGHSAANEKLKALAAKKGITLPSPLSEFNQKLKIKLSKKMGKDFDKAYADAMVKDHQDDIKEFSSAIATLQNPELKDFATSTLPTLKMHLAAMSKIHDQIK